MILLIKYYLITRLGLRPGEEYRRGDGLSSPVRVGDKRGRGQAVAPTKDGDLQGSGT